jgi:hypothetical protein
VSTRKKKWSDLTPGQRKAAVIVGAAELVLTSIATADLKRRPAAEVRGPKVLWMLAFLVQPFGPIAYFTVGRRS